MSTETMAGRDRSAAARARGLTLLIAVALGIGALITAFPFFWMLATSVKPQREAIDFPPTILPQQPTLEWYGQLFTELDFGRYLINTVIVVLIGFVGLLLMAMAGYAFAKFDFRGRRWMFFLVLATMMIPVQVTMIPTYLILNGMKLTNTLVGIALPTLVSGFSIFLFRQFMSTIPTEMLEAARLDGAGEFRTFWQIVLPMSGPISRCRSCSPSSPAGTASFGRSSSPATRSSTRSRWGSRCSTSSWPSTRRCRWLRHR